MRRLLAVALVVLGIGGLVLGRLGETVWAPETHRSATVALKDPGAAVLIDPGVAYVGGHEGTLEIEAPDQVHVISAPRSDATAYLGTARYTEITGVPDWSTLRTRTVNPTGEATLPDPASADLWSDVRTSKSPADVRVADLWKRDGGAEPARPYRALLLVTDGTKPGASKVTITWPVERSTPWVPYAYAIGAVLAVLGLGLFAADYSARTARWRRAEDEEDAEEELERTHAAETGGSHAAAPLAEPDADDASDGGSHAAAAHDESAADQVPDADHPEADDEEESR